MYQNQGAAAYKADLANAWKLSAHLGAPENNFKTIHVAGTNGKGSVSHMLASVLQESGYKVGLYTSPHLKDFRERIKINGEMIPQAVVVEFVETNKAFFEENELSFFEMTVGLAFQYFTDEKVDVAIIEVGMGGRLDSTNIITPLVSIITNIGLDHTQFLGETLEKIAFEKAGIIKPNVPVVIGQTLPETKPVFIAKAKEMDSEIVFASEIVAQNPDSDLKGDYQFHNKKTALAALQVLRDRKYFKITGSNISSGLLNVVKNTGLLGRWQKLGNNPTIIADTAHNKDGIEITMAQLKDINAGKIHIVVGFVNDKDIGSILKLLPKNAVYYFCRSTNPRSLDEKILKDKALGFGLTGNAFSSVSKAFEVAKQEADPTDVIYIGGSTFVVAELL